MRTRVPSEPNGTLSSLSSLETRRSTSRAASASGSRGAVRLVIAGNEVKAALIIWVLRRNASLADRSGALYPQVIRDAYQHSSTSGASEQVVCHTTGGGVITEHTINSVGFFTMRRICNEKR